MTKPKDSQLSNLKIQKTSLPVADKIKFMTHVNEEHQDELAMFIEAFTDTTVDEAMSVKVAEVYTEGLQLKTLFNNGVNNADDNGIDKEIEEEAFFIPFAQRIDDNNSLKSQYILLLQQAAKTLGKPSIQLQQRRFKVLAVGHVSANMYRLQVLAPNDTPLTHPGYAYLFDMAAQSATVKASEDKSVVNIVNENNEVEDRANNEAESNKAQRYYTLRKAWQDEASQKIHAFIDVYLHGDTAGGNWAREAQINSILHSVRDYPEKIAHLSEGQCLLICDETSLPTVANLLELWHNPLPPMVIVVTHDATDISYLNHIELSDTLLKEDEFLLHNVVHIHRAVTPDLPATIMAKIQHISTTLPFKITKVWGALEAKDAKGLRAQLKSKLGLSRQDMVLKVYWRDDK